MATGKGVTDMTEKSFEVLEGRGMRQYFFGGGKDELNCELEISIILKSF